MRERKEIGIKLTHGKLGIIPWFVQDIHGKETQLGDCAVDCTVRKASGFLKPPDVIAEFIPRNRFRFFMKNVCEIIQISPDVSAVTFKGMVGKTAKGNHFPERI